MTHARRPQYVMVSFVLFCAAPCLAADVDFRAVELPTRLTVGYAVKLVDVNGDKRLDIVVVDSKRVLWLENPNWTEHVLIEDKSKTDNVCLAPADIDGDGRIDFALGADWTMDTQRGGTIQWITRQGGGEGAWSLHPIGEEPAVHRMRFVDLNGDGRSELLVLPLFGRNTTRPKYDEQGTRLLAYRIPDDPVHGPWQPEVLNQDLHVTHNFSEADLNGDGQLELFIVSFEGVHVLERQADGTWRRTRIGTGDQESSPNRGASEVKYGRLAGGRDYVATIEPWHGNQVVVYTRPTGKRPEGNEWLWERKVLDKELQWGHAVWCENLDDDPDEELIIGVRDDKNASARRGIRIYDPHDGGWTSWSRQLVDPGGVAVEDLAVADLNGDGRADLVAVGRQTHNARIYFNLGPAH